MRSGTNPSSDNKHVQENWRPLSVGWERSRHRSCGQTSETMTQSGLGLYNYLVSWICELTTVGYHRHTYEATSIHTQGQMTFKCRCQAQKIAKQKRKNDPNGMKHTVQSRGAKARDLQMSLPSAEKNQNDRRKRPQRIETFCMGPQENTKRSKRQGGPYTNGIPARNHMHLQTSKSTHPKTI